MRICSKCSGKKDESEFHFKNRKRKIFHSYCKDCKRQLDRDVYANNNRGRKKRIRENANKRSREGREFVIEFKKNGQCLKCGDTRWYVLDFHHKEKKEKAICDMARSGVSIKRLHKELLKCSLLCSNCHREEHYLKRLAT